MLRERSFVFHIDAVMLTYPSIVGAIPCPAPLGIGVHLICFAHLRDGVGSSLFMGVFPSLPPAYYCALNIDTLSRGVYATVSAGASPRPTPCLPHIRDKTAYFRSCQLIMNYEL